MSNNGFYIDDGHFTIPKEQMDKLAKDLTKVIYAICACFTDVFQFVTHCVTN